jgi:hypothetical protein
MSSRAQRPPLTLENDPTSLGLTRLGCDFDGCLIYGAHFVKCPSIRTIDGRALGIEMANTRIRLALSRVAAAYPGHFLDHVQQELAVFVVWLA